MPIPFELLVKVAIEHKLKSSNIHSVDYDKEKETLKVSFHSGGTYTYKDVPKSLFDRIKKVKSPGKFFHKHIKKDDKYSYEKLEKEAYELKTIPSVVNLEAAPRDVSASNADIVGNLIFGKNYIPFPRQGEDVSDAFRRMENFRNAAEIQGNILAHNPVLERLGADPEKVKHIGKIMSTLGVGIPKPIHPILGGDVSKASRDIAEIENNPSVMSQFKQAGEIPKKVRDAIFAGEKKLLKEFGKRGGNKAAVNKAKNHFKKWLDMGEEIVHPASDYTKQPNLPGM